MEPEFARLIPILDSALRAESTHHPFGAEALQRLGQLDWLCKKISDVESLALAEMMPRLGEPRAGLSAIEVELLTLTESFYYTAWRLIGLLDGRRPPIKRIIGMRKACVGIRTVRNQLLEHPEGANSGAHVPAIVFGHGAGPQLKVIEEIITLESGEVRFRTFGPDLFDKGLWSNSAELREFMLRKLQQGV